MTSRHDDTSSTEAQLSAAYAAFAGLAGILTEQAGAAGDLLPVFVTAAADAADGRDALCMAPSMPPGEPPGAPSSVSCASPAETADRLAGEARVLAAGLGAAALSAGLAGDREALGAAARCAQAVHACLAGTG